MSLIKPTPEAKAIRGEQFAHITASEFEDYQRMNEPQRKVFEKDLRIRIEREKKRKGIRG